MKFISGKELVVLYPKEGGVVLNAEELLKWSKAVTPASDEFTVTSNDELSQLYVGPGGKEGVGAP